MDRENGFHLWVRLKVGLQLRRIHVVGSFVDVDEGYLPASLRNGFGGGDEGVRHRDDGVAFAMPAAISAKRRASVPLLTPIQ